ncbi:EAL domain-containing protein [Methylomonas sp. LL1]|nr:EAL domain-containing protein [Methylomonas sp. LL1]
MIYRSVFINSVELPYQRLYQVNRALRASEAKFQAIINESPIAYLLYDDQQRISFLNPAFINTFGFTMADLPNWSDWWLKAFPDPEYRQACLSHWRRHLQRVGQNKLSLAPMELDVCGKDGRKHTILINIAFLGDAFASQQVILLQDITERVETMQLIWRQSYLDPLTELPNRNQFLDKLAQAMNQARKLDQRLALLFIDLDRFKDVNDALGHVSGDILLREAGKRLREAVGDSQPSPARLGGDEFTVIIGDLENHPGVDAIAQAILQSLARPFDLGDETVYLSASIGIAFYPDDADKSAELLKKADQAMFEAKKQGRDRYSFFTPEMQRIAQNRMRLLNELHGALAKQQFMVYYQPIVEFPSGKICKAEALLRWRHPDLGMISPAEFIPLAEETGMIVDIGEWVFNTAAQQVKLWRQQYHPQFQVSINKSPVQFRNERYDREHWPRQLRQFDLPGQSIVIEITEGLLLEAGSLINEQLLTFRNAGMQVALDDFGTGYSSLAYLKKFDIDYLKIDQAFVRHLSAESSDMALCEAIIVMAHKLGIKVVAEGIETAEQFDLLINAGCDFGQGYLFSRPVPADEFDALLSQLDTL